jgi:hypothetical protein
LKFKSLSPFRPGRDKVGISGSLVVDFCIVVVSTYFTAVDGSLFNCVLPVESMEMFGFL